MEMKVNELGCSTEQTEKGKRRLCWTWRALPIKEWFSEVSRSLGRHFLPPFGMYGLLAMANTELSGIRCGELGSWKRSVNNDAACIFASMRKLIQVGGGKHAAWK